MWAATHSERNFHDPYSFKPERWLGVERGEGKTNQWGDKRGAEMRFRLVREDASAESASDPVATILA